MSRVPARRRSPVVVVVLLLVLGLLGGLLLLTLSIRATIQTGVSAEAASSALQAVRARIPGPPRAELREVDGRWLAVLRADAPPAAGPAPSRLHALLWEPAGGRLIQADAPGWAVSATRWKLRTLGGVFAPLQGRLGLALDVPDEVLAAPGLLLDHEFADGRRLLVWGE